MAEKRLTKKQAEEIARAEDTLINEIKTSDKKGGGAKEEKAKNEEKDIESALNKYLPYAIVVIIAAIIIYLVYFILVQYVSTPFSTFLSNFNSGQRVAIAVSYRNTTQLSNETPCYEVLLEVIARHRSISTIDFFIVNSTTCTYSPTGFGPNSSLAIVNASKCLSIARSEPSIFLNYSTTNKTTITPYHLYIYGDSAYMRSCRIAGYFSS